MKIAVKTSIRNNRIPEVAAKFPAAVSFAVKKAAFDIEAEAKRMAPVDTGRLSGSISANVKRFSATIAPHTEYDAYVELGTWKMSAQPYMRPAADKVEPEFTAAMVDLIKRL